MRIFGFDIGERAPSRPPLVFSDAAPIVTESRTGPGVSVSMDEFLNGPGWATMLGGPTDSGVPVNPAIALNFTAVFSSIGIISDALAQVPLNLLRRTTDANGTTRTRVASDHPLQSLLHDAPNEYMSSFTWRQTGQGHTLGWGNGYSEIERTNGGDVVALWPLMPDATGAHKRNGELYYRTAISGTQYELDPNDVLHIAGLGFDGICGYSPLAKAREAVALALAAERFGAKFFKNDAKSGGFMLHPGKLGDKAVKNIAESFEKTQGGLDNAHRIKVLEEGMKFISTTIAPNDAQFLATRSFQVEEIARLYRVPLVMLNSMEKTSSWGTGIEQLMIGFVVWTMTPWVVRWEGELNRKLLTQKERDAGYYFKFNLNALMRGDMAARSKFYHDGIQDGWLNRNEARGYEDLDAAVGLDTFLVPLNMGAVDPDTGELMPAPNASAPGFTEPKPGEDTSPPAEPKPPEDGKANE